MALTRRYQGVTAFSGLPGSGKTYSLAEVGAKALADGRQVWCNAGFDLVGAHVYRSFDEMLHVPDGSVILLDEAPIYFNARRWAEFPDSLLYRFTQVRKDSLQLYYSTIDESMVDKNLRILTFWVWECEGITGRLFRRCKYPPAHRRKATDKARERKLVRVKDEVASLYDTTAKVAVAGRVVRTDERTAERWSVPVLGTDSSSQSPGATEDPSGGPEAPRVVELPVRPPWVDDDQDDDGDGTAA